MGHKNIEELAKVLFFHYLKQRQIQRLSACAQVLLEPANIRGVVEGLCILFPLEQVLRLHACQGISGSLYSCSHVHLLTGCHTG